MLRKGGYWKLDKKAGLIMGLEVTNDQIEPLFLEKEGMRGASIAEFKRHGRLSLSDFPDDPEITERAIALYPWVTDLLVLSDTVRDLRFVDQMPNLQVLRVLLPFDVAPTFANAQQLTSYLGPLEHMGAVLSLPKLYEVVFEGAGDAPATIEAPLQSLRFDRSARLRRLPKLRHPELLQSLSVHGSRSFSLAGAREFVQLNYLDLETIGVLGDVEEILELPIERLFLVGCPQIPNFWRLLDVRAEIIAVDRGNPFPPEFRAKAKQLSGHEWVFPRGKRYANEA